MYTHIHKDIFTNRLMIYIYNIKEASYQRHQIHNI